MWHYFNVRQVWQYFDWGYHWGVIFNTCFHIVDITGMNSLDSVLFDNSMHVTWSKIAESVWYEFYGIITGN
jgi:hypothetical protein